MKTYQEYCDLYNGMRKDVIKDIKTALDERGVEYINVYAYRKDYAIDEDAEIYLSDKNGYGVLCRIDYIEKTDNGWNFALVDEFEDDFCDYELGGCCPFDTSALIDIYGLVQSIFEYADEECGGRVCGKGEDLEDVEED